jgi:urea transporter
MVHAVLFSAFVNDMPVFLERFVIPILATSVVTVILLNPFKWDWVQRTTLLVGIVFTAFFFAYTDYKARQVSSSSVPAINQQANDSDCSNISATKEATVNCSPPEESHDASKQAAKQP